MYKLTPLHPFNSTIVLLTKAYIYIQDFVIIVDNKHMNHIQLICIPCSVFLLNDVL